MKLFFTYVLIILGVNFTIAQQDLSNLRSKKISFNSSVLKLDTLSVIPSSIQLFDGERNINSQYDLSILQDSLYLRLKNQGDTTTFDSINIIYRVFPFDFGKSFTHLDSLKLLPKQEELYIAYDFNIYKQNNPDLLFSKGLEYDGSFARGLSFGNSQSLVLNSAFNLQLGGKLGDDLEIIASISDANLPIQPEGTTQQLQDFDKVFIQLKKDNTTLIAGDYEIARPDSYFINYYKKLQGLSVIQQNSFDKFGEINQKASVAISRGKFSRNTLVVREGNQGPYKLTGSEGERFLIVLSGTEKVYFDGKLLTRGQENDYVIFYDRAEIEFTTNRLVTKDSRIIVEFEYADQKYLRSLYQYNSAWKKGRFSMDFNLVSQQDSRNTVGSESLDSLDLSELELNGDLDQNANRSGIVKNTKPFSSNKIYYDKIFDDALQDSILVATSNPDSADFIVNFSDVGVGNGAYAIENSINSNGRVYKYVGEGNGSYEPFVRLVAPEQKQMYAIRGRYSVNPQSKVDLEIAMSYFDLNRFSTLADDDNMGWSGKIDFQHSIALGKKKNWLWEPVLSVENKGLNFRSLNPYRNAEFNRDWNVDPTVRSTELLGNYGFSLREKDNKTKMQYSFGNFKQTSYYSGQKHNISFEYNNNGTQINFHNNILNSDAQLFRTAFSRPRIDIQQTFKKLQNWSIGWHGERERNERYENDNDLLEKSSFLYDYTKLYISSNDKDNFSFGMSYNQRNDFSPEPGEFTLSTKANEYEINGKWRAKKVSNASWSFTYRDLQIKDESLTTEKNNSVLLGNLNHILRLWKGAVNSTVNYKVSSGQEPKIEFDFREVLVGEGNYIWIDDGDDIQQRNEFQIAPFRDQANYIRINLFNNEFIRTNNAGFTQSLRIDPKVYFRQLKTTTKTTKLISKFSIISNYRLDNKNTGNRSIFSLDQFSPSDTALVSYSSLYNGILYYNRGNPKFDIQFGVRTNTSKISQTLGFEQRGLKEYYIRNRTAISRNMDFIASYTRGGKSLISEIFASNDFDFIAQKIAPKISYRYGNKLRLDANYIYELKSNKIGEIGERALINDFNIKLTYSKERTSRITGELKFAQVSYSGAPNTSIELNMLDGLKNGQNLLWTFNYVKRIMKNVDINFSYEGRKTGDARIVHVGRAQVKSTF